MDYEYYQKLLDKAKEYAKPKSEYDILVETLSPAYLAGCHWYRGKNEYDISMIDPEFVSMFIYLVSIHRS